MRALVMDDNAKSELARIKRNAHEQRIPIDVIRKMAAWTAKDDGTIPPFPIIGDRPSHVCYIQVGFKVVFSVEEHPRSDKSGTAWVAHLSVSVDEGKLPNFFAMKMIAAELGLTLEKCQIRPVTRPVPHIEVLFVLPTD